MARYTSSNSMIYDKTLLEFTRGRFVWNEEAEMAKRQVDVDLNELAHAAAAAVSSKSCIHIEKFPDGMHNKAYCLTMDDGRKVVAKVPNPNAGSAYFTTASEVATMKFVRIPGVYRINLI